MPAPTLNHRKVMDSCGISFEIRYRTVCFPYLYSYVGFLAWSLPNHALNLHEYILSFLVNWIKIGTLNDFLAVTCKEWLFLLPGRKQRKRLCSKRSKKMISETHLNLCQARNLLLLTISQELNHLCCLCSKSTRQLIYKCCFIFLCIWQEGSLWYNFRLFC